MQQISQQLGTEPSQTQQAVSAALPMLLGMLGQNASLPQGLQALFGGQQKDGAGAPDLSGLLGSLLGGGSAAGGAAGQLDGTNILDQIFGSKQADAEASIGKATGLGGDTAAKLLKILAPIVMAYLAKRSQGGGQGTSELGAESGQKRDQGSMGGGIVGTLLDKDGNGKIGLNDLLQVGGSLFGKR